VCLWSEMTGEYFAVAETQVEFRKKGEQIYNLIQVPFELEPLLNFGFLICFDSFLYIFTFLPMRIALSLIILVRRIYNPRIRLSTTQSFDILRGIICIICFFALQPVDISGVFHLIQGQAVLKLYVIFNLLEILDKLCVSFGQDIFDSLWISQAFIPQKKKQKSKSLQKITNFIIALIYVYFHSIILFIQVETLSVAISSNAYNSALITLLVSNQFSELKASVFKTFKEDNLFKMTCRDMVERFQLVIFLCIIVVEHFNSLHWGVSLIEIGSIARVVVIAYVSECLVDYIKHAFVTKFNLIPVKVYAKFSAILCSNIVSTKTKGFLDSSHSISRKIMFVPLPLGCLVLKVLAHVAPLSGLMGVVFVATLLLCLAALKIIIRVQLLRRCLRLNIKEPISIDSLTSDSSLSSRTEMVHHG